MADLLLCDENIEAALAHLLSGKNSRDPEGNMLYDLPSYWQINRAEIREAVNQGIYLPHIIEQTSITQSNGRQRTIYLYCHIDRLLLRALHQHLSPIIEPLLSPHSYAYRPHSGAEEALAQIPALYKSGYRHAMHIDIYHFFDCIDLECLWEKLEALYLPQEVASLIQTFLYAVVERDGVHSALDRGVLQGSPLSPLLSNLYLNEFDSWLSRHGFPFFRYADDIFVLAQKEKELEDLLPRMVQRLSDIEKLSLSEEKTTLCPTDEAVFLGHRLSMRGTQIAMIRAREPELCIRENWHIEALSPPERQIHLLENGILRRKDFSVLFENESIRRMLPPVNMDALHLHDDVTLSSGFLRYASQNRLRLCFYDRNREYLGDFVPCGMRCQPEHTLSQAAAYLDAKHRLKIAKAILDAAMHNMLANVRYYAERKDVRLGDITAVLEETQSEALLTENIEHLMLVEGRFRETYYSAFPVIADDPDFRFAMRTRRPPRDSINAMISFGNTIVYQRVATEVYRAGLDIRISFLHSAVNYRDNLSLDIAEIYKPLWVDRTIFSLINKHMIDVKRHFFHEGGGVFLNSMGKRLFLKELRKRISQRIRIDGRMTVNAALMRTDLLMLKKHLNDGMNLRFYHYR